MRYGVMGSLISMITSGLASQPSRLIPRFYFGIAFSTEGHILSHHSLCREGLLNLFPCAWQVEGSDRHL